MADEQFCTIITADYMPFALSLLDSLKEYQNAATLHVLVADTTDIRALCASYQSSQFRLYSTAALHNETFGREICERYAGFCNDRLRWSLKPVFLLYLLKQVDTCIFLDPDVYCCGSFGSVFGQLENAGILLTPHWYPFSHPVNPSFPPYHYHFVLGLYNAGFVGASQKGKRALEWWAEACYHSCTVEYTKNFYVDQTHLNLLPVYFDEVEILKHKGCNVAFWNVTELPRVQNTDGSVSIDGEDDIIFIHFAINGPDLMMEGHDPLLFPCLEQYVKNLRFCGLKDYTPVFKEVKNLVRFTCKDMADAGIQQCLVLTDGTWEDGWCSYPEFADLQILDVFHKAEPSRAALENADGILVVCKNSSAQEGLVQSISHINERKVYCLYANEASETKPVVRNMGFYQHVADTTFERLAAQERTQVLVFGAGEHTRRLLSGPLPERGVNIVALMDDDPEKHGMYMCGVRVVNSEEARKLHADAVIVSAEWPASEQTMFDRAQRLFPDTFVVKLYGKTRAPVKGESSSFNDQGTTS